MHSPLLLTLTLSKLIDIPFLPTMLLVAFLMWCHKTMVCGFAQLESSESLGIECGITQSV